LFSYTNHFFLIPDTCQRCTDPVKNQLTKNYLEFITNNLIPILKEKTNEYKEWWIFKPSSPLAIYIQQNNYMLNLYFRPSELVYILKAIADAKNMYAWGNNDVIILDEELQNCFNTTCIYLPKLYSFCLCHVNVVTTEKCTSIKNEIIKNELFVDPPLNIIFNDPTSQFWIPQKYITSYNNNYRKKRFTYPWKDLNSLFFKFICRNDSGITQLNNAMFQIQPNCTFAEEFQFKFFHTQQVPIILKQITKFLGKSNNLLTLCSDLKFFDISSPHDSVIFWIEEMITKNYNQLPYIPSCVSI
jgi:hypothetical protein